MIHHEIRIREAKDTDVSVLASGVQAVFTETGRGFYLVAEIAGEIVGCLLVTREWSDWRDGEFWMGLVETSYKVFEDLLS